MCVGIPTGGAWWCATQSTHPWNCSFGSGFIKDFRGAWYLPASYDAQRRKQPKIEILKNHCMCVWALMWLSKFALCWFEFWTNALGGCLKKSLGIMNSPIGDAKHTVCKDFHFRFLGSKNVWHCLGNMDSLNMDILIWSWSVFRVIFLQTVVLCRWNNIRKRCVHRGTCCKIWPTVVEKLNQSRI